MSDKKICLSLNVELELLEVIDKSRGLISRTAFIKDAIKRRLQDLEYNNPMNNGGFHSH